ncbi:acetylcholine receptor subunit beta-type unc-29-like [Mercenaria mercenaria]|uniref:acetylcholine receptor subunit beta-type unc-29-like n=1 Tax=Mercenaria mercenaria TaxID=6596 RepID=UPI00234EB29A|nr:acetylcholine receptor subunit beta-type unc-29-like [Mercenaria mercenaria]
MLCKSTMNVTCFLLLVILFSTVTGHTMMDAKKLLADKQQNYEKTFRPLVNQSAPMVLYTGLELLSIQAFDEVQEKLTIAAVVTLYWVDEYMKWNQSDYGNLEELVIESDKVWTPNLVLVNNVEKLEKIGDAWQVIRFTSDGIAYYYPGNVFHASCRVDVTYYPWDRHRCEFSFNVWAHSKSEIVFKSVYDKVQTTYFSENGAWAFYNSSVENYNNGSFIDVSLYLERKPRFVLVNVILPIIFLAFLNVIIFAIPIESGERISYSITMLLAIAVFLTLVGDNLPKTSSPMSFFSYYLLVILVISICITLGTIFNVRLYYSDDDDPVHRGLTRFVRCVNCKSRKKGSKRKPVYSGINHESNWYMYGNSGKQQNIASDKYMRKNVAADKYMRNYWADGDSLEASVISKKTTHHQTVNHGKFLSDLNINGGKVESERNSGRLRPETFTTDTDVSWKDVSVAFDKIFFALSFLILSIATFVFFMCIFANERR